jgi:hypothetical protein
MRRELANRPVARIRGVPPCPQWPSATATATGSAPT